MKIGIAAVLVLLLVCSGAAAAHANHDEITWTAWNTADALPGDLGNYYLDTDVTLPEKWLVKNTGTTNLCLNGHVIKMGDSVTDLVINVPSGATLNLYDCGTSERWFKYASVGNAWTEYVTTQPSGDKIKLYDSLDNFNRTEADAHLATPDNEVYIKVTGGVITGGSADFGGGVYVSDDGTFTMSGGNIIGNSATQNGGGVYVGSSGEFTMTGGSITGNIATNDGGGVYVYRYGGVSTFTMTGGSITGNSATGSNGNGGGVCVSNGEFTMKGDASIKGNSAANDGGGVYVWVGTFTMSGTASITGNSASSRGGGVYNADTFEMSGTAKITGNSATGSGGGVYNADTFEMSGTAKITGNSAPNGGGVLVESGTFNMSGTAKITDNEATTGNGGGVYVFFCGTFTMSGTAKITDNEATTGNGGGVYVEGGTFTMTGGSITGNSADNGIGGGVYVYSEGGVSTFTMTGGSITGNSAEEGGGGVYVAEFGEFKVSGSPEISGNTLTDGTTKNNVYLLSGTIITIINELKPGANIGVTNESADAFAQGTDTTEQYNKYTVSVNDAQYFHHDTNAGLAAKVEDTAQKFGASKLVWETKVTVTFDRQGHGTSIPPVNIGVGSTVPKPTPDPTEVGYTFSDWYKEDRCTNKWIFETDTVSSDTTLHANWTLNKPTISCSESITYGESLTLSAVTNAADIAKYAWYDGETLLNRSQDPSYTIQKPAVGSHTYKVTITNGDTPAKEATSDEKTVTVTKKSISSGTITLSPDRFEYDGTAKEPAVTLVVSDVTLTKDTDYTVEYSNNIEVGTATVTVTGKGNYEGTLTTTFTIIANQPQPSSSSRSSGSSVLLPAVSADTQGAQTASDITAQYTGHTFVGVSAGDVSSLRTVSPELAATAEIKISTAKAAGIKVTNSKGAPALILTNNAAEGLDAVAFCKVYDIKPTNPNEKLTQVTLTVPKADVAASRLTTDDVTIYHFLEVYDIWVPLDTLQITEDEANYYYTAATDGTSPFGVLIKKFDTAPVKPVETSASPVPVAGVLAGLGAALVFGVRRK